MGFLDRLNDANAERQSMFDSGLGTDASDTYANKNQLFIEFYHLPSDKSVAFKAYIKDWSDKFQSNYKSEDVYGRNDPIHTFQGTSREISLSWQVVAASAGEAQTNLARVSMLAQFLYPSYKVENFTFERNGGEDALLHVGTMTKAPLIKVRFANMIIDSKGAQITSVDAKNGGLLCALSGLTITADLEAGVIDGTGLATPKVFNLSTNLKVIHQHSLGWQGREWLGADQGNAAGFPYNSFGPGKADPNEIEDRYSPGSSSGVSGHSSNPNIPPTDSGAETP